MRTIKVNEQETVKGEVVSCKKITTKEKEELKVVVSIAVNGGQTVKDYFSETFVSEEKRDNFIKDMLKD